MDHAAALMYCQLERQPDHSIRHHTYWSRLAENANAVRKLGAFCGRVVCCRWLMASGVHHTGKGVVERN
jgi:hypothetical protein